MRAGAFWAVAGQRVPPRQLTGRSPLHSGEERAGRVLPQRALDHRGRLGPARGQHRPALRARGRGGPGARAASRSRPHLRAPGHRGEGRPVPRRPRGRVPGGAGLSEDPPAQLLSQEPNPGVRYEYHLPLGSPRPGFRWSHGSWSDCSAECGGGEPSACCGGTWGKPRAGGLHVPPPAPAPTPKLREPAVAFPRCWYLRGDLILCAAEARPGADDQLSERGPNTPDNTPQASVSSSVNWGMMMALILGSHLRLNQDDAWDVCRIVPSPRMHRVTAD